MSLVILNVCWGLFDAIRMPDPFHQGEVQGWGPREYSLEAGMASQYIGLERLDYAAIG